MLSKLNIVKLGFLRDPEYGNVANAKSWLATLTWSFFCPCTKNANDLHNKFSDILNIYQIDEKLIVPLKTQLKYTFEYFNTSNEDNTERLKYSLRLLIKRSIRLKNAL